MNSDAADQGVSGSPPPNSVQPETRSAWRQWLTENHDRSTGVWLITFKKASGKAALGYAESVEEALCFGWIDSIGRGLDAERTMLWFTSRKRRSGWSRPNKERVERLLAAGLMAPPGLAKVEAAKLDGSWQVLDAVEALEVPPDLAEAFATFPNAARHFDAFPRSVKRAILEWIVSAKRPDTRGRRIEETARLAEKNERANQWRREPS